MSRGCSIIYVDEATFSAKTNKEECWQPPGENSFFNLTDLDFRCVACIAAIELRTGKLHSRETLTALQHTDVISFLSELDFILKRRKNVNQYSVFLDNASIHRSKNVLQFAAERGIDLLFNVPYRPDLNGIEYFWADMKKLYRRRVLDAKVQGKKFDQF